MRADSYISAQSMVKCEEVSKQQAMKHVGSGGKAPRILNRGTNGDEPLVCLPDGRLSRLGYFCDIPQPFHSPFQFFVA